jgi:pimeloyl-ACP methyl ester carboxylesterase
MQLLHEDLTRKIIILIFLALTLNTANAYCQETAKNISVLKNDSEICKFNHQTGKYFETDGANIYYEEIENKGKPVLLFLHGGFGTIESLNAIVPLFCNDFYIIGIDSRGHGKSTLGTKNLTYKQLQLDVEAVLNHLQINNVSIIGFSDGGIVAYRMAAANKVAIKKLVTIGATWSLDDAKIAEEIAEEMSAENCKEIFADYFEYYQKNNPSPDFDKFARLSTAMWADKTESGYPQNDVAKIKVPTLIIRGNDDDFLTLESAVDLSKKIDNSLFLNVPFSGHAIFKKQPEIFKIITKKFLNNK